jgi:hypothetical protein
MRKSFKIRQNMCDGHAMRNASADAQRTGTERR